MGSTTSCSITGISFSSTEKRKDVKKRLIQAVAKEHNGYYIDYDFTAHDTVTVITDVGIRYVGSLRCGHQVGGFTITKTNLLQSLCKC